MDSERSMLGGFLGEELGVSTRKVSQWVSACVLMSGLCGAFVWAQALKEMAPDAHPSFEVATIKPADPANGSQGYHTQGRQIYIENMTVLSMIMFGYGYHPRQIVDAPEWVDHARWDVKGVPDAEGTPNMKQYQEMVRKLLTDRFGFKMHPDTRELTVYALRVAKGGPKITKNEKATALMMDQTGDGRMMKFTANTMNDFTVGLQYMVDRPVVDQTGLQGRYDFTLRWLPDGETQENADRAQMMFSAMPEQLGLKLEATKAPTPVLVVEHAERPEAN